MAVFLPRRLGPESAGPTFFSPPNPPLVYGKGGVGVSAYSAAVLTDGPMSYWRLDESSGTAMVDQMGVANGAYAGSVTLAQPSLLPADPDQSVLFTAGRSDVPGLYGFAGKAPFTVECWAQNLIASSDAINRRILGCESASLVGWCLLYTASTTSIGFERGGTFISYAACPLNTVTHVVGTYDGTSVRLYINGSLVAGPTSSSGSIATQSTSFRVGGQAFNTSNPFDGYIDEVAVYNVALSAAQIANHYGLGAPPLRSAPDFLPALRGPKAVGPTFFAALQPAPVVLTGLTIADPGSLTAGGQSTATLAMATAYLGALSADSVSTGAVVLSRPEPVALITAASISTTALALAPVLTALTSAATSTGALVVSRKEPVALNAASATSTATMSLAPVLTGLTTGGQSTTTLTLAVTPLLSLSASGVSGGSATVSTPQPLTLSASTATSGDSLALTATSLLTLGTVAGVSSTSGAVTTPGPVPFVLSTAATSTGSLTVQRPEPLGVLSASGVADGSATLTVRPLLALAANSVSTGSATISSPQPLALNAAAATATATLALQTVSGIPLAPTSGQASASLDLFQGYLGRLTGTASSQTTATITSPATFTLSSGGQASAALTFFQSYLGALGVSASSTATATVAVSVLLSLPADAASSATATISTPITVALDPVSASATTLLDVVATALVRRWPVSTEPRWSASVASSWPGDSNQRWPSIKEPVT